MADHKITDFVDQSAIDGLARLKTEMNEVKAVYIAVATELVRGLKVPVDGMEQLERLTRDVADLQRQAADAAQRHSTALAEQGRVVANTTNTISRQLMEQERVNKTRREAYTEYDRVKKLLEHFHDTYEGQLQSLAKIDAELSKNKEAQKANAKALKEGRMSLEDYGKAQLNLIAESRRLRQEKSMLNQIMTAEEKANLSVEDSYAHMSQQLELLKKAYKQLSEEGRTSEYGQELEQTIQNLDAHLKDMAADQGEFQRNVGNYAIACQNGVASTEDLNRVLQLNAATIDGCIEQNKSLEKAKNQLDQSDENYAETLDKINTKIEENRARIMDVSDVMEKMPSTVEEADEQNKRLSAALKMVDVHAEGASETIRLYRDRIDSNNEMIERVTGSNEEYADSLLSIIGINGNFGQSFQSLANSGGHSFIDGLNTKVKAFGKTLMGLLANPWVLAFLGIAGVAAGVKWWFDYNAGLVEATKKTHDFTGLTGNELKAVRNEVQGVAETFDKDFTEVLEAANAMSKQFGISFQESLKLIEDGFVAGADVNGEFLENIKEYPAYFKEAGISASEFIAITTQANQAGIYSDKGIDVIKEGNLRIREMTTATAAALDGIGISSKQVVKDLSDGSKTTFDIMKEVSEKLAEFPESSTEVGTALADIFGGPGEDAGLQYILTLKDIDTNLDNVKDRAGELAELQEEQLRSQVELENVIASVFDATGGSFESMTTKAKTFVNDGIIAIIKGCVDIVNWFVRLYNKSIAVRAIFNSIVNSFKTIWSVAKFALSQIIDGFKALGDIIEGVFTLDLGKIKEGYQKGINAFKDNFMSMVNEIKKNTEDAVKETLDGEMKEVTLDVKTNVSSGTTPSSKPQGRNGYKPKQSDGEKKTAEKAAQEQLKILQELEDAKIEAMEDGHEKELALIRQKHKKRIDNIKGNSEEEKALRIQYLEQMNNELAECELKYQQNLAKINLENRLAIVKKGSKEELDLKLAQLEANRAAEIEAAKKTGADVSLINAKFDKQRQDMLEEFANAEVERIQDRYAIENMIADNAYNKQLQKLKQKYVEELQLAGNNSAKREEITQRYEANVASLSETYAQQRAADSVNMLESILDTENLSADERARLEQELAAAKIAYEQSVTDAVLAANERQVEADKKATEKRIANVQKWMQVASEGLNAINDLASAIFDAKIERIEAEQEANTEAGEAEQERISELVEKNVITEEEGEARKRAAEAKTQQKEQELEKKKQQLKHKQAVWDKANAVAQAGIATALAIMNALQMKPFPVGIAMAAIAGAMGAVQIATILATPIPKYAKGTKDHPGGLAIVGDGGRQEVVSYGGNMFLTPDTPTLIDMPKGAEVFPDADKLIASNVDIASAMRRVGDGPQVVVNNDYSDLKREVVNLGYLIKMQTKTQRRMSNIASYEQLKASYGL